MATTSTAVNMEWSNDTVMKFLDIYEREPVIWEPSHKLHKHRNEVYDAWKRIQTEFSEEIPIPDLKKKRDSLMATFRNCLNKVKASETSGASADQLYKPNWFAYAKMARFLLHHDTPRNTINSENIELINDDDAQDSEIPDATDDDFAAASSTADRNSPAIVRKVSFETPPNKKKKRGPEEVIYDKMEKAYDILSKKSQPKEKDECDIFGELIAKRLRKMEQNERDFMMHEIENAMYQSKMRASQHSYPQSIHQSSSQLAMPLAQPNLTFYTTDQESDGTIVTLSSSPSTSRTPTPYAQYGNPPSIISVQNDGSNSEKTFYESL